MSILRLQRDALEKLWKEGLKGQALLAEQSRLADIFIASQFDVVMNGTTDGVIAIVALGGYGRSELFPYSDIDLLILFREDAREKLEKVVNGVLYPPVGCWTRRRAWCSYSW